MRVTTAVAKRGRGQRLLHSGYARLLRTIVDAHVIWRDLHEMHGLARQSAQRILHVWHDLGFVHVDSWRVVSFGGRRQTTPVYAFGPGASAPWTGKATAPRRKPAKPPVELLTFVRAIEALQGDHLHGTELADTVGIAPRTARALLRELHALGLIFKAEYQALWHGGHGHPLFAWGPGRKDRARPKPQPRRVLWARADAIKRARGEHLRVIRALAGAGARAPAIQTGPTALESHDVDS